MAALPSRRERIADALQRTWSARGAASTALLPLSFAYEAATALRRTAYRFGARPTADLPVPVIVVGNLLAGGAGKTPAVIAITAILRRHGFSPGIVSRGYGRQRTDRLEIGAATTALEGGDEPVLLRRRTGVPIVVAADRVAAGHALLQAHPGVDIIVADDGLQHLALGRDVEVIVFDERGAGNGRLLPAGPLRQRLPRRLGPRQLVLYNAERATTPLPGYSGERRIAGVVPLGDWWRDPAVTPQDLDVLRGRPMVVAAAGLARPERFFAMLREHGLDAIELALPDHHDFAVLPWPTRATDVIVTEKDAIKLVPERRIGCHVWVAALDFDPEPAFEAALLALLSSPTPAPVAPTSLEPNGNTPA